MSCHHHRRFFRSSANISVPAFSFFNRQHAHSHKTLAGVLSAQSIYPSLLLSNCSIHRHIYTNILKICIDSQQDMCVVNRRRISKWLIEMPRLAAGKQRKSAKILFICVGLLGAALIADLLWASSTSSSARSFTYKPAFDWPPPKTSSDSFPLPVSSNHSAKVSSSYFLVCICDLLWL